MSRPPPDSRLQLIKGVEFNDLHSAVAQTLKKDAVVLLLPILSLFLPWKDQSRITANSSKNTDSWYAWYRYPGATVTVTG